MTLRDYFVFFYLDNGVEYATNMLRKIARNVQQVKFYSAMGDETADISNGGQLFLCIRRVNDDMQAHEDSIRIHKIPNITADEIAKVIKVINLKLLKQGNYLIITP